MRKILATIVLVSGIAVVKPAWAMWPDLTPVIPVAAQFCPQCSPAAISTVTSTIQEVKSVKDRFEGANVINMLTQSAQSYLLPLGKGKFNFAMQKWAKRRKVISYSRTIENCTIAGDITDEEMVKSAFMELFLQYPSKKSKKRKAYVELGEQFKIDTTLEMYITAREMNKEMQTMLAELDKIERCLVAGEDCSEQGMESYNCQKEEQEDEVCLWRNALNVARIYDQIMRYNEFLQAMNAQYDAVKSISTRVPIKEYQKNSDASSVLMRQKTQMVTVGDKSTTAYAASYKFDVINNAGVESPMKNKKDDFESLQVVTEIQKKLNEAVLAHNFKRTLPDYLKVFQDYHEMNSYYLKTVENVIASEDCIIRYLDLYYDKGILAWLGADCKRGADGYECPYAMGKFSEDNTESYGLYDTLCEDDKTKKCYVLPKGDYSKRGGISGWLLKFYEEAGSTEMTSENDVYVTMETDSSQGGMTSLDDMKKTADNAYQNDNKGTDVDSVKDPSMEEDIKAMSRKEGLMKWTLGAETAKIIASDIMSATPTFGNRSTKPTIWNDYRYFYDLYIDGKYENIKQYIQDMPLLGQFADEMVSLNKSISYTPVLDNTGLVVKTADALREEAENDILKLKKQVLDNPNDAKEIDSLLQEEATALQSLTQNLNQTINQLNAQKAQLYQEIAAYNEELTEVRDTINAGNADIDSADETTPKAEEGIEYGNILQRGNSVSRQAATLSGKIKDNKDKKSTAVVKKETSKLKEILLKTKIKSAKDKVEKITAQIETAKANYIKEYSKLEYDYKVKIDKAAQERAGSETAQTVANLLQSNQPAKIINGLFEIMKQYAITQVAAAEKQIKELKAGNVLYYPVNNDKVVEIHSAMLEKIRNVTLEDFMANEEYAKSLKEIPNLATLFDKAKEVFAEVLQDKELPDNEYFVGIIARERDLRAPKQPPEISVIAPLREVFHFDLTDFGAVRKYFKNGIDKIPASNQNVTLIGASFLDSGLEIPEIWRHILKHRAFVEQDIDFDELLNQNGNPAQTLVNSGIYPCFDEDEKRWAYALGSSEYAQTATPPVGVYSKQTCTAVKLTKAGKFYTLYDAEAGTSTAVSDSPAASLDATGSELGQILDYVDEVERVGYLPFLTKTSSKKLTFRQELLSAMKTLSETDSLGGDKPTEKDIQYYKAERVQLDRNQFGDFLDNIEQKQSASDAREQLLIQVLDLRQSLKDMFEQLGYTISDDFDLTNVDDYNMALEVMEKHKNNNMRSARELIATLKGKTDYLAAKKAELEHGLKVLEKDDEEQTNISLDDDLDELEEKIKNSAADKDVADAYSEEGSKAFKQQMEWLRPPYCAVYNIN